MNDANNLCSINFNSNVDVFTDFKPTYLRTLRLARLKIEQNDYFLDYYEVYINVYQNIWEIIDWINHGWYHGSLNTIDFYYANNIYICIDFLLKVSRHILQFVEDDNFPNLQTNFLHEFDKIYIYIKNYLNYKSNKNYVSDIVFDN